MKHNENAKGCTRPPTHEGKENRTPSQRQGELVRRTDACFYPTIDIKTSTSEDEAPREH